MDNTKTRHKDNWLTLFSWEWLLFLVMVVCIIPTFIISTGLNVLVGIVVLFVLVFMIIKYQEGNMELKDVKRDEGKDIKVSLKISQSYSEFMKRNKISPTMVFNKAIEELMSKKKS